jgi:hypothetical protein
LADLATDRGRPSSASGAGRIGDRAEGAADRAALQEEVAAEAAEAADAEGEVELLRLLEAMLLGLVSTL